MKELAIKALKKGAKAKITSTDYGFYVEVGGYKRIFGKFKFNKDKKLIGKMIIERDFYPFELAVYELSKKRVYKKRTYKRKIQ